MASRSNWLKWSLALLVLLVLVVGAWVYYQGRPTFTPPPLPEPNGYEQLLNAAEKVAPRTGFYDEMETEELAAIVQQNEPVISLTRDALDEEIAVPVDWSRDPSTAADPATLERPQAIRNLSRALLAEAQYWRLQQRPEEAIARTIEAYRLGAKSYRGGLIIDLLVGIAIQGGALEELRRIAEQNPDQHAVILRQLLEVISLGEPADDVLQREQDYIASASRSLTALLFRAQLQELLMPAVQATTQAALRTEVQERLLALHLAIEVYHQEHEEWPAKLEDVAELLDGEVPQDPYSQGQFVYRVEDGNYLLYSVGSNGQDDGGVGDETGLKEDVLYPLVPKTEQESADPQD
jgi:hypothetical protein